MSVKVGLDELCIILIMEMVPIITPCSFLKQFWSSPKRLRDSGKDNYSTKLKNVFVKSSNANNAVF